MCGRYYIDNEIDDDELEEILQEIQRKIDSMDDLSKIKLSGEIYPTNVVPIVANNKNLAPTPFMMKWGFTAPWDEKKQIINARSETASQKNMFKKSLTERRCLIPATNYFEWQKTDAGKVKHAIKPRDQKMMYMAGLYRYEHDSPVFTILTREPAENISFIHNRMPLILPRELKGDWLNHDNDAEDVMRAALMDMEFKAV
jgi:putative SOS response-associated peptidase YedK